MTDDEERLEEYLCRRYDVVGLSNNIRNRLKYAYNSDLQVKPDRLLQCWRMMEQYLNNTRLWNDARGQKKQGMQLLGYDLSIVLNNYERFMRKIANGEKLILDSDVSTMHEITRDVLKKKKAPKSKRKVVDVSAIVKEIYDSLGE